MSPTKSTSHLLVTALVAIALFSAGCKKEETAQQAAPAPAQESSATPTLQEISKYDFENGLSGWSQSAKGIKIGAATDQKHDGNSSLKISGNSGSGVWNFGGSPKIDLEPGKQYKLTGWIYVDSWDKSATPPMLKLAIHQNGKWVTNAFTNRYNLKKVKEWQLLTGKVTVPTDGTIAGSVGLEKGTQDAIQATVYLDDVKLEVAQ